MKKKKAKVIKDWIKEKDGSYVSVETILPGEDFSVILPGDLLKPVSPEGSVTVSIPERKICNCEHCFRHKDAWFKEIKPLRLVQNR
jgi:hypothetical protein